MLHMSTGSERGSGLPQSGLDKLPPPKKIATPEEQSRAKSSFQEITTEDIDEAVEEWFAKHGVKKQAKEVPPPALAQFVQPDGHLDMFAAQKYLDAFYGEIFPPEASIEAPSGSASDDFDLRVDLDQPPQRVVRNIELKPDDLNS